MKLEQLQSLFLEDILHPSPNSNSALIDSDNRLSPKQRIEIYAEGYQLRLLEGLMDNYPAIHTLLGDEDFDNLGREYIAAHPSKHFSLRYFGSALPHFIKKHTAYEESEFLYEMAKFEWELRTAFDSKDSPSLTRKELTSVKPEKWIELQFKPHSSFSMITCKWNTPALWKAIIQDEPPRPPQQLDNVQHWLIWRPLLETHFRSADDLEILILKQFEKLSSFTDICELISLETGAGAEQVVINYLSQWVDEGLLLSLND